MFNEQELQNNMPLEERLLNEILMKYYLHLDIEIPEDLKVDMKSIEYFEGYSFGVTFNRQGKNVSRAQFLLKEYNDGYAIGFVPHYNLEVKASEPAFGYHESGIFDGAFENAEERFWDYIGNTPPIPQRVYVFLKNELTDKARYKDVVRETLDALLLQNYKEALEDVYPTLCFWFTRDIILPAFNDQTAKHQAHQVQEIGLFASDINDVIDHIAMETDPEEGHMDLDKYLWLMIDRESFNVA